MQGSENCQCILTGSSRDWMCLIGRLIRRLTQRRKKVWSKATRSASSAHKVHFIGCERGGVIDCTWQLWIDFIGESTTHIAFEHMWIEAGIVSKIKQDQKGSESQQNATNQNHFSEEFCSQWKLIYSFNCNDLCILATTFRSLLDNGRITNLCVGKDVVRSASRYFPSGISGEVVNPQQSF